jgi:hypothetical protein
VNLSSRIFSNGKMFVTPLRDDRSVAMLGSPTDSRSGDTHPPIAKMVLRILPRLLTSELHRAF